MIQVIGLHHVSLLVIDTRRALGFYQDILGLALIDNRPDIGIPGAWLDLGGGQQLHLLEIPRENKSEQIPGHGGRDRHFALAVAGLDEVTAALEAAGIAYTLSRSGRRALFCRDPEGNVIELLETT